MTVDISSSSVLRDELAQALVKRGVPNGGEIATALADLEGCMATVAWWDDRRGAKTPGLLVHMLRTGQQRDYSPSASPAATGRRRWDETLDEMRAMGFDERELPFAASAWLTRGPTTVETMRAHLKAQIPSLYEEIEA